MLFINRLHLISHGKLAADVHGDGDDDLGRAPARADPRPAASAKQPSAAGPALPSRPTAVWSAGQPAASAAEPVSAVAGDARLDPLPLGAAVLEPDLDLHLAQPQVVRDLLGVKMMVRGLLLSRLPLTLAK